MRPKRPRIPSHHDINQVTESQSQSPFPIHPNYGIPLSAADIRNLSCVPSSAILRYRQRVRLQWADHASDRVNDQGKIERIYNEDRFDLFQRLGDAKLSAVELLDLAINRHALDPARVGTLNDTEISFISLDSYLEATSMGTQPRGGIYTLLPVITYRLDGAQPGVNHCRKHMQRRGDLSDVDLEILTQASKEWVDWTGPETAVSWEGKTRREVVQETYDDLNLQCETVGDAIKAGKSASTFRYEQDRKLAFTSG